MRTVMKRSLALDFHENSKQVIPLQDFDANVQYKIYPCSKAIALDKNPCDSSMQNCDSFISTLLSRKSTRTFVSANISMSDMSKLLTLSFGLRNDASNSFLRTYASAGARYPIEVYVVVKRSDDLEKGIYHYNIKDNTLELIKKGDYTKEIDAFYSNQKDSITTNYPCLILFSIIFKRSMQKYGEKGYRFALLDAGHMSQNLYLVASYLNLGIVGLGAGADNDDTLDDILGLVSANENLFYGFFIGHPLV